MKMTMTNEAKTGLLVLVCAAALGSLLLRVGNTTFFPKGYVLSTRFEFAGGVKKHAPVCLSGVEVGEVKDIRITYGEKTFIEVDLWLEEGVQVRKDSKATIATLGLMGEKYVEIRSGASSETAAPGESIAGVDPVRFEDLLEMGTSVAGDISQMAKDISRVANTVDGTVQENRPKIGRIFVNLEETSLNFKDFSQDIKFHPWKILAKGKEKTKEEMDAEIARQRGRAAEPEPVSSGSSITPKNKR